MPISHIASETKLPGMRCIPRMAGHPFSPVPSAIRLAEAVIQICVYVLEQDTKTISSCRCWRTEIRHQYVSSSSPSSLLLLPYHHPGYPYFYTRRLRLQHPASLPLVETTEMVLSQSVVDEQRNLSSRIARARDFSYADALARTYPNPTPLVYYYGSVTRAFATTSTLVSACS